MHAELAFVSSLNVGQLLANSSHDVAFCISSRAYMTVRPWAQQIRHGQVQSLAGV